MDKLPITGTKGHSGLSDELAGRCSLMYFANASQPVIQELSFTCMDLKDRIIGSQTLG